MITSVVGPCRRRDSLAVDRRTKLRTTVAIILGTLPVAAFAEPPTASSQELQDLRRQVQQLQQQLDRVQAQQEAATQQTGAVPASASTPAATTAADPGITAGPLTLTFGGFAELAGIYRNRNETADVSTNFNTLIPFPNSPQQHLSEFRASARQSRLSLLTQGPQDEDASAEAYLELDFQSAAPTANSVESNSYNPRMRQFYATYNRKNAGFYLLAGQTYSLVTLQRQGITPRQEQIPLTIDGQYVPGFNWTRNPQLRFVKDFGKKIALGVSLESPQASIFSGPNPPLVTTVFNAPGGFLFAPTTNYSTDVAPDVVAKISWDPGFGHYELYGLGRAFRDRAGGKNVTIYGSGGGGGFILPIVAKQLDFQGTFLVGRGIGRYGSAQLPDVAVAPDGRLASISGYSALVGLIYRPASAWTVYGYAGVEHADSKSYTAVVNNVALGYGYGSPLYNNSGCEIEGSTLCAANTSQIEQATLGAWWKYYQGKLGNMQLGLQGAYTRRKIFDGVGGNPNTNMIGGMLSFRYYPYQR